jgi:prolycopene isomerase
MEKRYDVIVVGAGNAGLVAAATTAKNGLSTLLLEKHNLPGGCATSFCRGRFEFEPSLHELASVGTAEHPTLCTKSSTVSARRWTGGTSIICSAQS